MEKGIIRFVALLCAVGSLGLAWAFGVFVTIPAREGRLLAMNSIELQVVGISFAAAALVAWGSLHLLALADRVEHPAAFRVARIVLGLSLFAAAIAGAVWAMARIVSL